MFNNILSKLKVIAKVFFWVGAIACVGFGLYFFITGVDMQVVELNGRVIGLDQKVFTIIGGLALMIGGTFLFYAMSLLTLAFVKLVANSNRLKGSKVISDDDLEVDEEEIGNQLSVEEKAKLRKLLKLEKLYNNQLITKEEFDEMVELVNRG